MPHLTLEFSSNIIEKNNFPQLFKTCHEILVKELSTDLKNCKSRSFETDRYCIGDGSTDNAFIHINVKVKPGRSKEILQNLAGKLMSLFQSHFATSLASLNLQITLEVVELQDMYLITKSL